ncbi:DCN1-like protein 5 isoform X1 [Pyrus x bretschneideri]|uniref:DCN1-like protein 5 isoform X1 n=1 Tax=Pyrus x bretschneideri TaxID=225117 RepID=UPI00202E7764|nr:DCN1-like protein 5 isoform X1 [Pyrus x bretschneideri]
MPRASKRKAPPPTSPSLASCDVVSKRAATGKGRPRKDVDKIDSLFESYANQSLNMIDPTGIEALCSDLKVDHTDVRILMLAWKMRAAKQGYFSKDEWQRGLKDLHADTIPKLKKALPGLEKELTTASKFEDFYAFAFQYCLTEERQKSVDIETVCELLNLVLGPRYQLQVDLLIKYLKVQTEYRALNMDQWMHFYRFCNEGLSRIPPIGSTTKPFVLEGFCFRFKFHLGGGSER